MRLSQPAISSAARAADAGGDLHDARRACGDFHPKPTMNVPSLIPTRLPRWAGAAVLTAAAAVAQTAPARPGATTPQQDETVQLATFTVTAEDDQGYYAPNAISGTRTKTE